MTDSGVNAARWTNDPTGRHELRYWDGEAWTEHVSDQGVQSADPPTMSPPIPSSGGAPTSAADAIEPMPVGTEPEAASPATASGGGVIGYVTRAPLWAKIAVPVAVLILIAAIAGGGSSDTKEKVAATRREPAAANRPKATPTTIATVPPTIRPTTPPTQPPTTVPPRPAPTAAKAPAETAGQSNARRMAVQYLRMGKGFSRQGLIEQLSSPYGEGYSIEDATYGVDATNTDWNAQACLSAKSYLDFQPFSRAGLIDQLSSSYGEGFTPEEAEYGVTCAGL